MNYSAIFAMFIHVYDQSWTISMRHQVWSLRCATKWHVHLSHHNGAYHSQLWRLVWNIMWCWSCDKKVITWYPLFVELVDTCGGSPRHLDFSQLASGYQPKKLLANKYFYWPAQKIYWPLSFYPTAENNRNEDTRHMISMSIHN